MEKAYENSTPVNRQQSNSLKICSLKFSIWESLFTLECSLSEQRFLQLIQQHWNLRSLHQALFLLFYFSSQAKFSSFSVLMLNRNSNNGPQKQKLFFPLLCPFFKSCTRSLQLLPAEADRVLLVRKTIRRCNALP